MLEFDPQKLASLRAALTNFQKLPLAEAGAGILASLGYKSDKTADFGSKPEQFVAAVEEATHSTLSRDKAHVSRWKQCAFLFQLTNDEIPSLAGGQQAFSTDTRLARSLIESFVFLAIELQDESWSRTDLAAIARELNRRFPMPAIVIFKHGELLSLVVIDRRANLKDATRDVIDNRITVIKDVRIAAPHRAHLDILGALALENLGEKRRPANFRELYDAWIAALSIQALNKRFYTELAWWYFWAVKQVTFPLGGGKDENRRNSVAVIRLLTRLIFSWFIKEKGLIPEALFDPNQLKTLLKSDPAANGEDSIYYHAILQNLFFASLNVEMGADRKWAADGGGMKGDRLIHSLYRHKEMFREPDHVLSEYFSKIPFLNGGLFECLDRELTERDFQRNPELKELAVKEGSGWVLRVDGFSRRKDAQPIVPNKIFFGGEAQADLNADLGTKGKRFEVLGLIDIFGRYKFTVEENTPVEEEVALDPELLGKVFENLLASYNEDTQATARKQSGSFYTPREVVDYMVDEALIAYFERALLPSPASGGGKTTVRPVNEVLDLGAGPGELDLAVVPAQAGTQTSLHATTENDVQEIGIRLRRLLSYTGEGNDFSPAETGKLIAAIESLKILDPACGSGAFPMGMLQKLVHVLKKLDPSNELWKTHNRAPLAAQLAEAKRIPDPSLRETKVEEAESALAKFDRDFANAKHADYTRKLYLIEKCIFGVDIQPIAVQIAKLRFFIALVVSQEVDKAKENWGITALPNLETKIVAADSLTPIREVKSGMMENFQLGYDVVRGIEAELHDASERYFSARTTKTKRKYREIIQDLRDKLASELEQSGFSTAKAQQLVHWNPFDQNAAADFFDPEWMFQLVDGFDVVIGNPPYIKEATFRKTFERHHRSPYYQGKMDIWYLFACQALDRLKRGSGVISFIATNNWTTNAGASILRREIALRTKIVRLIDFVDYKVFGEADIQTMILVACNDPSSGSYRFDLRRFKKENATENDLFALLRKKSQAGLEYIEPEFSRKYFSDHTYTFAAERFEEVLGKIKRRGNLFLNAKTEIAHGIDVLQDFVNKKSAGILGGGFNVGDGIFVISHDEKQALNTSPDEAKLLRPYYTTGELRRYVASNHNAYWIIYTDSSFKNAEAISSYPNIKRHLDKFRNVMTSDNAPYGLHRARKESFFQGEKILSQRKCAKPSFTYTNFDCYVSRMFVVIKTDRANQKYLTGVLNSSLIEFWLRHRGKLQGHQFQIDTEPLENIPLFSASHQEQSLIGALVSVVQGLNSFDAATSPRFEQLINGLILELYFPDDLHRANIRLFDACDKAGVGKLTTLKGKLLVETAQELADRIFVSNHSINGMLFDLQGLEVVRIVEGNA